MICHWATSTWRKKEEKIENMQWSILDPSIPPNLLYLGLFFRSHSLIPVASNIIHDGDHSRDQDPGGVLHPTAGFVSVPLSEIKVNTLHVADTNQSPGSSTASSFPARRARHSQFSTPPTAARSPQYVKQRRRTSTSQSPPRAPPSRAPGSKRPPFSAASSSTASLSCSSATSIPSPRLNLSTAASLLRAQRAT